MSRDMSERMSANPDDDFMSPADEWKQLAKDRGELLAEAVEAMKGFRARALAAEQALAQARKALEPFAKYAKTKTILEAHPDGTLLDVWHDPSGSREITSLRVRDFLKAEVALRTLPSEPVNASCPKCGRASNDFDCERDDCGMKGTAK